MKYIRSLLRARRSPCDNARGTLTRGGGEGIDINRLPENKSEPRYSPIRSRCVARPDVPNRGPDTTMTTESDDIATMIRTSSSPPRAYCDRTNSPREQ